jgi:hypothetical protein
MNMESRARRTFYAGLIGTIGLVVVLAACEGAVGSIGDSSDEAPPGKGPSHGNDGNGGAPDPGGAPTPGWDASGVDTTPVAPPPPPPDDATAPPTGSDTGGHVDPGSDSGPLVDETSPPTPPAPPPGTYPSGPYGYAEGNVFPNATLHAYVGGSGAWTTITLQDYYDPDGSRKINGIFIDVSASWCGACQAEAGDLPSIFSTYKPRGARFLTALIEDVSSSPATETTIDDWQSSYHLPFDVAADPDDALIPKGGVGLPHNYVIDPRTMQVVKMFEGADPGATTIPGLDALLTKNGG